jgi:hypothetical protein
MASRSQDNSRIVSVRLPEELIGRLDRSLDWCATSGRVTGSRNAAMREALRRWLDDQEQLAGFVSPETLRVSGETNRQFRTAYAQVSPGHAWVLISRLRQQLQWPRSDAPRSWRGSAPLAMWSLRGRSPTRHRPPTPKQVTRCTVISM